MPHARRGARPSPRSRSSLAAAPVGAAPGPIGLGHWQPPPRPWLAARHRPAPLPAGDGPNISRARPGDAHALRHQRPVHRRVRARHRPPLRVARRAGRSRCPPVSRQRPHALRREHRRRDRVRVRRGARCNADATAGAARPWRPSTSAAARSASPSTRDRHDLRRRPRPRHGGRDRRHARATAQATTGCAAAADRAPRRSRAPRFPTVDPDTRTLYVPGSGVPDDTARRRGDRHPRLQRPRRHRLRAPRRRPSPSAAVRSPRSSIPPRARPTSR